MLIETPAQIAGHNITTTSVCTPGGSRRKSVKVMTSYRASLETAE